MDAQVWATTFYDVLLKEIRGAFDHLPQKPAPNRILEAVVGAIQKVYAELPSNATDGGVPPSSSPLEALNAASSELMQAFGQGLKAYLTAAYRALSGDLPQPLDDLCAHVSQTACDGMRNIHERVQEKLK